MNLDLTGKRALVAGSTQGIGKAIAIELAKMGASITLLARNEDSLKETQEVLDANLGQQHSYICADFQDVSGLEQKVKKHIADQGPINILINNTGGPAGGPIIDASLDAFSQTFSNHLLCNHVLTQAVVEGMKSSNYGRIINVISTSVKAPLNNLGVSNTIRGAVANWSKTMANELGKFGITVNNVLPGATNTVRLKSIAESNAAKSGKTADEVLAGMAASVPLGRIAEANEVANAAAFLASPAASYINGINIPVDGGRTPVL